MEHTPIWIAASVAIWVAGIGAPTQSAAASINSKAGQWDVSKTVQPAPAIECSTGQGNCLATDWATN